MLSIKRSDCYPVPWCNNAFNAGIHFALAAVPAAPNIKGDKRL